MKILVDKDTKVLVQGITGNQGTFHSKAMIDYGTKVVAGVTPKRGGQEVNGVPVYNTIKEAQEKHEIDATVIFVPAKFASGAMNEAIDANIPLIIVITEHVPVWDAARAVTKAKEKGITILGPNTPGLVSTDGCKLGIMPNVIFKPGNVGVIARSGTLSYEVIWNMTKEEIGQTTCIGIGGDPSHGMGFVEGLELFEKDPNTKAIVLIGEIGGTEEEHAAEYIKKHVSKPVVAFIGGRQAPPGKKMGHAGAIVSGGKGTAASKIKVLEEAGVGVARLLSEVPKLLKKKLK
ncbi:MAG: succinate--CoA ligase subunit alpha [Candidatus Heimdallarchaeota archaeon]|nr:succinate--CoA ligase subunit alpha [Candidatus Heimdallarchaeota archaeon]MCK4290281.1 succinate--CoA ligase subunit alpha [Candidatus Heimdallarchaeota archaeon]